VPFSKLVERYREYAVGYKRAWDEEKYILEMFAKEFGGTPLSQITTWQIEKWKSDRRKDVKPGTVNRQLTVIKHMFKVAVEWGLTTVNPAAPVKRLPVDDQRTRFLTEDEIQNLLKACEEQITSPWLLPLVTLALNTGARQGELLGLRYEDIDQEQGLIYFGRTKNRRLKTVPMNDAVTEAIDWLLEHRYGDYLFMWPWSDIIGKSTVYDAFKKACGDAQIEKFRFHDLRHTFASHLVMEGVDLVTVKELMGHVDINMTLRYSHLAPEHKAHAVAKLGERTQGLKGGTESQTEIVSQELKEATGTVPATNLAQNRNVFLTRQGRGLKIVNVDKGLEITKDRIGPLLRRGNLLQVRIACETNLSI